VIISPLNSLRDRVKPLPAVPSSLSGNHLPHMEYILTNYLFLAPGGQEAEVFLPGRAGLLRFRAGDHDGGVQVGGDKAAVR
jgi:hypothetical protein